MAPTTDIVVMWTYHADSQRRRADRGRRANGEPVFGMSIAAYDGRIAIATSAHYRGTVECAQQPGRGQDSSTCLDPNSPGSGPNRRLRPGSSRIVAIHATSAIPKGRAELRANIFIRAMGWSAPTVRRDQARPPRRAFTKIPHIFLSIRPDGKTSYAYRGRADVPPLDEIGDTRLGHPADDDRPLDLAGAFPDPLDPQFPEEALRDVLPHVAATAEDLHGAVGDPAGHL